MAAARNTTKAMTLGQYPEMNGSRAMTGVRQMRASVRMFGSVQRIWLPPTRSAQRLEHHLTDGFQGIEDAVAADRHGLVVPRAPDPLPARVLHQELALVAGIGRDLLLGGVLDRPAGIQRRLQVLDRRRVRQVALVVLNDERDLGQVVAVFGHVVVEVL